MSKEIATKPVSEDYAKAICQSFGVDIEDVRKHEKVVNITLGPPLIKIVAKDVTPDQLVELKEEIDKSYGIPGYSIATNYEFKVERLSGSGEVTRTLCYSDFYKSFAVVYRETTIPIQ
jgi:hypothetical protein